MQFQGFVINCFYFCDPDGKTEFVQSREKMPVDDGTPAILRLDFEDIKAQNCHVAAAYFDGLPEQKIEQIIMKNITVTYAKNPKSGVPAMSSGVEECTKKGIFARNIKELVLEHRSARGRQGYGGTERGNSRKERAEAEGRKGKGREDEG